MKEKHIDDIWCLVGANKRCEPVPRVLLRNGKRGKDELQKSQASTKRKREVDGASNDALVPVSAVHGQSNATSDCDVLAVGSNTASTSASVGVGIANDYPPYPSVNPPLNLPHYPPHNPTVENPSVNPSDVFQAKVIESINILREDFQALRSEVSSLKTTTPTTTTTQTKYCSLYVRLADRESIDHIGKSLL